MPAQPKILQVVLDMRSEGFSDEKIVENLRQLGINDDMIKQIMKIADQDVYSKFKREMSQFVEQKLVSNRGVIDKMVDEDIQKRMDSLKRDMMGETEKTVGSFAKTVNDKSNDMSLALKKIREENLRLTEEEKLMRSDINLLLAGPSKLRLAFSIAFLGLGLLVMAYSIFFVTPRVIGLDFVNMQEGAFLVISGAIYVLAAICLLTIGVFFTGKPHQQ